ncbi:hypothetical protein WMY93_014356 [Mugilogobius chulae]|uniref:Uncharacterized protein n=1 Tax=Mugilogobius chulae TaxID=88201 RepID=A0AAW0P5X7_9GOBI
MIDKNLREDGEKAAREVKLLLLDDGCALERAHRHKQWKQVEPPSPKEFITEQKQHG